MSPISPRMRSTRVALGGGEGGPFLVEPWRRRRASSRRARGPCSCRGRRLRGTRWRSARRSIWPPSAGQAAVVAVELRRPDIRSCEPWNWTLSTSAVSCSRSFWYFFSSAGGEIAAPAASASMRARLDLGEFLEERGDLGEFLERLGLERLFHLGERQRVVLVLFLGLRRGAPLDHVLVVFVGVGFGLVGDLFLFLDRGAGGLLADLAFAAAFAAFLGLGRAARRSGPWTASPRDRGSRAAACGPR